VPSVWGLMPLIVLDGSKVLDVGIIWCRRWRRGRDYWYLHFRGLPDQTWVHFDEYLERHR
jgi:hypothetical protein